MMSLVIAVFLASLLGSVHCAGMCGAFLAIAVNPGRRPANRVGLQVAYNAGRLVTYLALGAAAGLLGAAIDLGGSAVGLRGAAAALSGVLMAGMGAVAVLRALGVRVGTIPLPQPLRAIAMRGHRAAAKLSPVHRAVAVGLLTTLLPCGWLYAFVITASGTGGAAQGAATMAVFWAGTLPVMIGLGTGLQAMTGALRRHLPLVTSLLVVAVGLWTLYGRVTLPTPAAAAGNWKDVSPTAHVKLLNSSEAPCCHDR